MPHAIAPYPPSLPPLVDRFAVARAAHRLVVHWPLAQMPRAMQRPKRPHQQLLSCPTPVAVSETKAACLTWARPDRPARKWHSGVSQGGQHAERVIWRSTLALSRSRGGAVATGCLLKGGRSSIIHHLIFIFMRGPAQLLSRQPQRPCHRSVASARPADVNVCRRSINVIHNGGYNKLNCRHARREFTRRKK
jgi:hypothetical protein